jgi:hypothetical protein
MGKAEDSRIKVIYWQQHGDEHHDRRYPLYCTHILWNYYILNTYIIVWRQPSQSVHKDYVTWIWQGIIFSLFSYKNNSLRKNMIFCLAILEYSSTLICTRHNVKNCVGEYSVQFTTLLSLVIFKSHSLCEQTERVVLGMRIEYTIFLMMRLKSFRPDIDKKLAAPERMPKIKKKVSNKWF